MKIFVYILLPAFFFTSCRKNYEDHSVSKRNDSAIIHAPSDREKAGLKGEVKEVHELFSFPETSEYGFIPGKTIGENRSIYGETGKLIHADYSGSKNVSAHFAAWNHKHNNASNAVGPVPGEKQEKEKITYKYSWKDHKGNWRKKYEYRDGALVMIITREIRFHE